MGKSIAASDIPLLLVELEQMISIQNTVYK